MANETLKAGFDAYMAKADAASAKFPERAHLEPANSGPCVCMLASPLLKNPTNGIATC